jgi:hypothetical protein
MLVNDIIANILSQIKCFCHIHYCWYIPLPIRYSMWIGLDHLVLKRAQKGEFGRNWTSIVSFHGWFGCSDVI